MEVSCCKRVQFSVEIVHADLVFTSSGDCAILRNPMLDPARVIDRVFTRFIERDQCPRLSTLEHSTQNPHKLRLQRLRSLPTKDLTKTLLEVLYIKT